MRHDVNLDMDAGAEAAAVVLGLGNALYKDVFRGQIFCFHTSPQRYVKLARGYRAADDSAARVFLTGQRTAVFLCK